jgi:hypothetical protein
MLWLVWEHRRASTLQDKGWHHAGSAGVDIAMRRWMLWGHWTNPELSHTICNHYHAFDLIPGIRSPFQVVGD